MKLLKNSFFFFLFLFLFSCKSKIEKGEDLSKAKIEFIRSLKLLDEDEIIILFESHDGFKSKENNGQFITNKRLASYWIDSDQSEENNIDFAYFTEIDSIHLVDLSLSLTYSSYLKVARKSKEDFKLYIDLNQEDCLLFFEEAIKQWENNKAKSYN